MGAAIGGAVGGIAGALSKPGGGSNAGNEYTQGGMSPEALNLQLTNAVTEQNSAQANPNQASMDVQNNPIQGQLYGQGGALSQAMAQYGQEQNQGYGLTAGDQTAYGQASGQIANQFGQSQQGLAQSLASRGLSDSGAAGAAFSNSFGNQNEQLAGLQTQIAQQRMNFNQNAMAQTQNFIQGLGDSANTAINNQANQNQSQISNQFNQANTMLGNQQGQANENMQQQQQSKSSSGLSGALSGAVSGASSGAGLMSSMATANNQNAQANYYKGMSS